MNILIACAESKAVCKALRERGHRAFSCDIQECSGGHPEWHIQGDVLPLLDGDCDFVTADWQIHHQDGQWDMIIAHPPCTYLSNCCTRAYSLKSTPAEKVVARWQERARAAIFFMRFIGAKCDKICVENPVGFMNENFEKPSQIIQPYYFSSGIDDIENYQTKKTCLWLKGLPLLERTNDLPKPVYDKHWSEYSQSYRSNDWHSYGCNGTESRQKSRSKTFTGIAKAMAEQWG